MGEHPEGQAQLAELLQHAADEAARGELDELVVRAREGDEVRQGVVGDTDDDVAARGEVVEGDPRDGSSRAGTSGAASRSGPAWPWTAAAAAATEVAS